MRVASGKASRVSTYQFSQRQLRGLVALLVLLPWIPVTLLWQVWRESNTHQREATRERLAAGYQQMLRSADNSLKRHLSQLPPQEAPKAAQLFFEDLFGQDWVVRLLNPQGTALGSSDPTPGEPLAQHFLEKAGLPWRVEVFLRNPGTALAGTDPTPAWILGLCVSVTAGIAVTAGITVSRQIALRELRNTAVATVAHELRTPLASMRMLLETLREGRCRTETQKAEYLELITRENERLSRLAEHFLTYSRADVMDGLRLLPTAPLAVVEQVLQTLGHRLREPECQFHYTPPEPPLPDIAADHDTLATALSNLLENALKYGDPPCLIHLALHRDGAFIRFSVRDSGWGIPSGEQTRIFEPFYQVDQKLSRSREGTGLGLAIVARIIRAHRGRIWVESQPGQGSVFHFTIPLA